MGRQSPQSIESYLQREDVQRRIRESFLHNRTHLTVPIGGAVHLFGFGENRLRKWEEKGLLNPTKEKNHRYYSLYDLDKLAILKELVSAGFSPGTIPSDIDKIWNALSPSRDDQNWITQAASSEPAGQSLESSLLCIDQRIEGARKELFWRYYASFVMRISLQLIREDLINPRRAGIGLVLALHPNLAAIGALNSMSDLSTVGASLVGWLAQSGSSQTLFTVAPSFRHPERYRIYRLTDVEQGFSPEKDTIADCTMLIVDSLEYPLNLNSLTIKAIQRLLTPLYQEAEFSRTCFDHGMRDELDPGTDLDSIYSDYILNGLAEMVIRLGNISDEQWRFCCILLPDDTTLPLQQRSLIVRAQSKNAPHKIGKSLVSPDETTLSLSLRAYQSGQTIYRPELCEEDKAIALRELEELGSGSAIALPTGGKGGAPAAILYVVSDRPDAFGLDSQRILRLVGIAIEETIDRYNARQKSKESLSTAISSPEYVDTFFEKRKILSENDFVMDIEALLRNIQSVMMDAEKSAGTIGHVEQDTPVLMETLPGEGVSIISVDIDKQSQLASRFGDQFTRNLSKVVGSFLSDQLRRILTEAVDYQLYHIWTDRFYLVVKGLGLEEARKHGERIRRQLKDSYEVSVILPWQEEAISPRLENKQGVELSVRVGVSNYLYSKLADLLQRYAASASAVGNVRALICRDIDIALDKGRKQGGDVVMSWNPSADKEKRGYLRWPPSATT